MPAPAPSDILADMATAHASRSSRDADESRSAGTLAPLWEGGPHTATYVARHWWPAALIAGGSLTFGLVWEYLALGGRHSWIYPVVGVLFLALGVYGLAVRPLLLGRAARRLRYAVSAGRVTITSGRWRLSAFDAGAPAHVVVKDRHLVNLVFAVAPQRQSPWGLWRLVDDRPRFSALEPDAARAALAALAASRDAATRARDKEGS